MADAARQGRPVARALAGAGATIDALEDTYLSELVAFLKANNDDFKQAIADGEDDDAEETFDE